MGIKNPEASSRCPYRCRDEGIFITEQAAADTDVAGDGQLWIEDATPNRAKFTDDAGNDFELVGWSLIAKTDLSGGAAASVTCSSIPPIFDHLCIVASIRTDRASVVDNLRMRLNGDTGANYDYIYAFVDGANARTSIGGRAATSALVGECEGGNAQADVFSPFSMKILNYSNTAIDTSGMSRIIRMEDLNANADIHIYDNAFHWDNKAAVTTILLYPSPGPNFAQNSVFSLYGIRGS